MMRETWYVLEDGTAVHPSEVAPNKDGRLAHKSGLVAIRPDGETPLSRGVDVEEKKKSPEPPKAKELKPEAGTGKPYKTRETKAE